LSGAKRYLGYTRNEARRRSNTALFWNLASSGRGIAGLGGLVSFSSQSTCLSIRHCKADILTDTRLAANELSLIDQPSVLAILLKVLATDGWNCAARLALVAWIHQCLVLRAQASCRHACFLIQTCPVIQGGGLEKRSRIALKPKALTIVHCRDAATQINSLVPYT
jgi:hypothetical protein